MYRGQICNLVISNANSKRRTGRESSKMGTENEQPIPDIKELNQYTAVDGRIPAPVDR